MTTSVRGITAPGLAFILPLTVFFTGSTLLSQGQAVCWQRDYGTATAADGDRDRRVSLPDYTNNMNFAGVVSRAYPAKSGGQYVEIALPGSITYILTNASATINANSLAAFIFQAASPAAADTDVGKWRTDYASCVNGAGTGTARIMQTVTGSTICLAELQTGAQAGGIEAITMIASAVLAPTGVSVITRTTALSTAAVADGTYIGQSKVVVVTGAASFVTTVVFGASKLNRPNQSTLDASVQGLDVTNIVNPIPGTMATCITELRWTGYRWRVVNTNLLNGAFT